MPAPITDAEAESRRGRILSAARWCFLNFGYARTSLDDVAKRAGLSRTLLYRTFRDKEAIYQAIFADWLLARHPAARSAAAGPGSAYERLLAVCRLMALEPWGEMVGAPMGHEFLDLCEQIDPDNDAFYRRVMRECVALILDDDASAEVFLLALDGLFADRPSLEVLEPRLELLSARFTRRSTEKDTRA